MKRIQELIQVLRQRSDLEVVDQNQSWLIVITKGQHLVCEVTVPHAVLEWHASVTNHRTKQEVWSDWMDYADYDDTPAEKLESEMSDHILAFINRVSTAEQLLPLQIVEQLP